MFNQIMQGLAGELVAQNDPAEQMRRLYAEAQQDAPANWLRSFTGPDLAGNVAGFAGHALGNAVGGPVGGAIGSTAFDRLARIVATPKYNGGPFG